MKELWKKSLIRSCKLMAAFCAYHAKILSNKELALGNETASQVVWDDWMHKREYWIDQLKELNS